MRHVLQGDWLKPGAVVIDCGINSIDDSSRKAGYRLVGDVDYASAVEHASHVTPVPGGVGPMTVAMLMENTVEAALQATTRRPWSLRPLRINPLTYACMHAHHALFLLISYLFLFWSCVAVCAQHVGRPVPSDIEIARAQSPKPIPLLASEIGILSGEVCNSPPLLLFPLLLLLFLFFSLSLSACLTPTCAA